MYAGVRAAAEPEAAWAHWRAERDRLFGTHSQSPVEPEQRDGFAGLRYYPYDPTWRVIGRVTPAESLHITVAHSGSGSTQFERIGSVHVEAGDTGEIDLDLFWLSGYGGGVFLPFRDGTAGSETYGGGRYLLDSAKGADLGSRGSDLILDFNFAYHPSCVYSPRWSCPLAPAGNTTDVSIVAGERL